MAQKCRPPGEVGSSNRAATTCPSGTGTADATSAPGRAATTVMAGAVAGPAVGTGAAGAVDGAAAVATGGALPPAAAAGDGPESGWPMPGWSPAAAALPGLAAPPPPRA